MEKLNKYDYEVIQYIYDNNNKEALFKLDDESLREYIFNICNILSEANEELEFGTFGEHYENDINTEEVIKYIKQERSEYNATHKV